MAAALFPHGRPSYRDGTKAICLTDAMLARGKWQEARANWASEGAGGAGGRGPPGRLVGLVVSSSSK